jgi:hypothetical protein
MEAIDILRREWDRLQPSRYKTLVEDETDAAWMMGFGHAIEILREAQPKQPIDELKKYLNKKRNEAAAQADLHADATEIEDVVQRAIFVGKKIAFGEVAIHVAEMEQEASLGAN